MSDVEISYPSRWKILGQALWHRFRQPANEPGFLIYFIAIVVIAGGFGWIEPFVRNHIAPQTVGGTAASQGSEGARAWVSGMYAYFLAITASAAVDFLIDQKDKDLFMVFVGGATAVVSCAALAAVYNSLGDLGNAEIFAIVGCLLSLTLWWLSNSDNSKLLVTGTRADAATGGNVDLLRGEIEGYRT